MSTRYASSQPAGFRNRIENVAIVGASGNVGKSITSEILKVGRQRVTALTRKDADTKMPEGVVVKRLDYNDTPSLVDALRGQDVLIITLGVTAPPDTERKLIDAASQAGVAWVIPNGWGYDIGSEQVQKDIPMNAKTADLYRHVESLGVSWTAVACGFWYEFSLAGNVPMSELRFGFDFKNKAVVFYDDGNAKLNVSTWPQVGRGTARLLDLKIFRDNEDDTTPCLDDFRNRHAYVSSFRLSQRDMLASVIRVTGDKESDWRISNQPVVERFNEGANELASGSRMGFMKLLYARYFYQDQEGDYEGRKLCDNKTLGLPVEDLDEFTKISLDMRHRENDTRY